MVVQQNRKSPSTVLTAHNSTGNRTFMCNTHVYNYRSNFGVTHVFSASSDTQAHVHTPGKLCITLGQALHFLYNIINAFYDLVNATWLQYELYWLRYVSNQTGTKTVSILTNIHFVK